MTERRSCRADLVLLVTATLLALAFAETILRIVESRANRNPTVEEGRANEINRVFETYITNSGETPREWFKVSPPPLDNLMDIKPEHQALHNRLAQTSDWNINALKVFNRNLVEQQYCINGSDLFTGFENSVYLFTPPNDSADPRYRYLPNTHYPSGLQTNQFGWRGRNISPDKGKGVVRLAFVGASTTVNNPWYAFSYPDYVCSWLNLWAQKENQPVKFECVNAAREGISSTSIAAVVAQEVIPLEPDIIVYYEGSNQFNFHDEIEGKDVHFGAPPRRQLSAWPLQTLTGYSKLASRVSAVAGGAFNAVAEEAKDKPPYHLKRGEKIASGRVDLSDPDLPVNLPVILRDLSGIERTARENGSELAVVSFIWMVYEGMKLNAPSQEYYHNYIERYWPLSYADLRAYADYQNLALKTFAEKSGVLYLPVAERFPRDPNLFTDAIHMTSEGERLKAWILYEALLPHVKKRLKEKTWPQPDREPLVKHPAFEKIEPSRIACIVKKDEKEKPFARLSRGGETERATGAWSPVVRGDFTALYNPATVTPGGLLAIKGVGESDYGYLAVVPPLTVKPNELMRFGVRGHLEKGGITVGLQENNTWFVTKNITHKGPFEVVWNMEAPGTFTMVIANDLPGSVTLENDVTIETIWRSTAAPAPPK